VSVAGGIRRNRTGCDGYDRLALEAARHFVDLWSAAHLAERLVARELVVRGVEGEQLALLLLLSLAGTPRTQTSLARELGVPFTTLAHAAGRLVARGDAERVPNARDRRSHLVALTAQGEARAAAAGPALEAALAALATALPDGAEPTAGVDRIRMGLRSALAENVTISE
jgi:DNA-binding MarR family transcriptional regulator